ncbi:MAG: hypothetical protein NUV56_04540 [Candidatus Uhrbacteria bacterium]|nr:hypothetical protein [Candidatus Uhrbacteria bacterium]
MKVPTLSFIALFLVVAMPLVHLSEVGIAHYTNRPVEPHLAMALTGMLTSFVMAWKWDDEILRAIGQADGWLHKNVTDPIFGWMQCWLHVNRFDLLRWGLVANILIAAIIVVCEVCFFMVTRNFGVLISAACIYFYVFDIIQYGFRNLWKALTDASERFEQGQFTSANPALVSFCRYRAGMRTLYMLFLPIAISSCLTFGWVSAIYTLHLVCLWLIGHLYDANDIDPRDRTYLMSPQDQEA